MLTRDALKSKNPFVTVQTLLTSFSENEIDEIKKWGEAIGADELNFKSLSLGSYTSEDIRKKYQYLLPLNPKFRRRQSQLQKTVCLGPLRTAVVFWNGDLGLCCVDFDNILKMPNIKKNGFLETFKSKEAILKRRKGFKMNLGLCQKCSLRHGDYLGVNFKLK
jgi:MoaA/NifB/PqqE/SkfB family radical SAM enzyme